MRAKELERLLKITIYELANQFRRTRGCAYTTKEFADLMERQPELKRAAKRKTKRK